MFIIFGFYKFKKFNNLKKYKKIVNNLLVKKNIRGTLIISKEGLNGSLSGKNIDLTNIIKKIKIIFKFKEFDSFNRSKSEFQPFHKPKIKIKNEVVPMNLTIKNKIKPGQTLMVGHIFLYNDRLKKVKELLPKIGNVQHIESNRLNWGRFQKKISTLHSLAPHDVSIIHYLLGYHEFQYIINIGEKFTKFSQNDRDEFSFECNGVSVKFNLSWYYPKKVRNMTITGDKGIIFWDEEAKSVQLTTEIFAKDRMNYNPKIDVFEIESNPLRNELSEFVRCVRDKKNPLTDVDNAIEVAKNLDLLSSGFKGSIK